jgi:hypothetical protein
MDTFLNTYGLSKLNQEDIRNLNISITSNETESTMTSLGRDGFTAEFHQNF